MNLKTVVSMAIYNYAQLADGVLNGDGHSLVSECDMDAGLKWRTPWKRTMLNPTMPACN